MQIADVQSRRTEPEVYVFVSPQRFMIGLFEVKRCNTELEPIITITVRPCMYVACKQVNHSPFAKATSCLREIEVSNWGNIAVEEHFELVSSVHRHSSIGEKSVLIPSCPSTCFLMNSIRDSHEGNFGNRSNGFQSLMASFG